jgi:hypothetical protein
MRNKPKPVYAPSEEFLLALADALARIMATR